MSKIDEPTGPKSENLLEVQAHLQEYLAKVYQDHQDLQLTNLTSITTGWENEMYAFDMAYGPRNRRRSEQLVLRIYPGDDAAGKSAREFEGMRRLEDVGYPVPHLSLLERDHSPFRKPFVVMERVDGQVMWSVLNQADRQEQQELLTQFCDLFVRLHSLDWRSFVDNSITVPLDDPYFFTSQMLEMAKNRGQDFPNTGLSPIVAWLGERKESVPCYRPSVVHFDYHPNNILLRPDGSAVVIDWPGIQVTDARYDLGWTLLLVYVYMGEDWRERILVEYERLAGAEVQQVEFFEIFACARRLFDITVSLSEGAEKLGMRPEAVQTMKEQMGPLSRVYDLLMQHTGVRIGSIEQLLDGRSSA